jgi:hypothetical protein
VNKFETGLFCQSRPALLVGMIFVGLAGSAHGSATGCLVYPPRIPPVTNFTTIQTLFVDSYGANGSDTNDDFTAIQNCINAAVASHKSSEIRFTTGGTYILNPSAGGNLSMNGATNIIFNGNGANILIENIQTCFLNLSSCSNILVKGFNIDYSPLPFTQGTIIAVHANTVDVQLMAGFPSLNLPQFTNANVNSLFFRDPNVAGRPKRNCNNSPGVTGWTDLGGNVFRVSIGSNTSYASVGDGCVITARINGEPQILMNGCQMVTVLNFTAYASPGAFISTLSCDYTGFINCNLLLFSNRWQTACADGILCARGGVGPWIENCYLEANGDDDIVTKGASAQATTKVSSTVYKLNGYGGSGAIRLAVGDHMVIYNPTNGVVMAEANIVNITGSSLYTVTFDTALTIPVGNTANDPIWFDTAWCSSNFLIRNCTLKGSRRFAITVGSTNGVIEGNCIESSQATAILLSFVDLNNGFLAKNITIRSNYICDNYIESGNIFPAAPAAIASYIEEAVRTQFAPWSGHQNILIENNTFANAYNRDYLAILCATNATVRNNTFYTEDYTSTNQIYAVEANQAALVEVVSNTIDDPRLTGTNAFNVWATASNVNLQSNNIVAPVVTNLVPTIDTWISSATPATSYGGASYMQIQNAATDSIGLAKFFVTVGTNAIQWARLKLTVYDPNQPFMYPMIYAASNGAWSGTVTWTTQPGLSTLLSSNTGIFTYQCDPPSDCTVALDVSSLVQTKGTNAIPICIWAGTAATNTGALATVENNDNNGPILSVKLGMPSPPSFTSLNLSNNSVNLSVAGQPGRIYILQSTTNLAPASAWSNLATNTANSTGQSQFSSPLPGSAPCQYFRLAQQSAFMLP